MMTVRDCIEQCLFYAVFQPIADLRSGGILGYEALIRGPRGSALETPQALFAQAEKEGCVVTLERFAARVCISTFVERKLTGKLFINFSAAAIREIAWSESALSEFMSACKLPPNRIVFELTEQGNPEPLDTLVASLQTVRDAGAQLALDDFGHGNANLNLWIALRPDYVKLGRAIVDGVSNSDFKLEVVKSMKGLATYCNATLIAEGLETIADLMVCRDAGIPLGQGYILGRPEREPGRELDGPAFSAICDVIGRASAEWDVSAKRLRCRDTQELKCKLLLQT